MPDMVSGKFVAELFGIKETPGQYTGNRSPDPAGIHVQGTLRLPVTVPLHLPAVYPEESHVFRILYEQSGNRDDEHGKNHRR
ncbi:MAG: hypothetical protein NTY71_02655 [Methanoregula sp.]|nr:hypothetical protein [Methanoregula sp.]